MTESAIEALPGLSAGVRDYLSLAPDADPRTVTIYLIWVRSLEAQAEREFVKGGLRAATFTIMRILFFDSGHRKSLTDLGREMGVSVTYVTRLSLELQREGWVERVRDHTDRRVTFVQLTPSGAEYCRERLTRVVRTMERTTAGMTSEEKEQLQRLLLKFVVAYMGLPDADPSTPEPD